MGNTDSSQMQQEETSFTNALSLKTWLNTKQKSCLPKILSITDDNAPSCFLRLQPRADEQMPLGGELHLPLISL